MSFFSNLLPYTNFHDLNMDWIIKKVMSAVQSVNGRTPDENGNVTIPQVEGVTSVNGILPDQYGNVYTDTATLNKVILGENIGGPAWDQYVVKIGRIVKVELSITNNRNTDLTHQDVIATGLFPGIEYASDVLSFQEEPIGHNRFGIDTNGNMKLVWGNVIPAGATCKIIGTYFTV